MSLELDLACVALACAMHNQAAVERFEETRTPSYQAQGWEALEGGSDGKRSSACHGLRGLRRVPRGVCYMGRQKCTKVLGGIQ